MATAEPGHGRFPPAFMQGLRQRIELVELVAETVPLRPAGREFVGLCPFHQERTPSFYVSREKQVYHCHGCHAGGDAVTFVMRTQGLGFVEAVTELAARAGVPVPDQRPLSEAERRRLGAREEMLAACAAAAAFFQAALVGAQGREAIAYLRGRGVDGLTAERFGLGYAPPQGDALGRALGERFPPEVLVGVGLRRARPRGEGFYDAFRARLMFPIWDERGRVVAFGGRSLSPSDQPKYLNSPETPLFSKRRTLYGFHLARPNIERRRRVLVVEGYLDAVACHQFGFDEAVASLGTALSEQQAGILARVAELVILAYDADPAGHAATEHGLAVLQERGAQVVVPSLPAGQDPDEALRAPGGERAFAAALDGAAPLIHFLTRRAFEGRNVAQLSPEQRWRVAEHLVPFLARVPVGAGKGTRQAYIEWVARAVGLLEPHDLHVAVDALAEPDGGHRISKGWNASPGKARLGAPGGRSGTDLAAETVLAACLRSSECLRRVLPDCSIHDFPRPAHQALVGRLLRDFAPGAEASAGDAGGAAGEPGPPGAVLLDVLEEPEQRELVASLLAVDGPEATPAVLRQCLESLRRARLQEELAVLRLQQRGLVGLGQGASEEMLSLTRRVVQLTAELARSARGGGGGGGDGTGRSGR